MKKTYMQPTISVESTDPCAILAGSILGNAVYDEYAGEGESGLSREDSLWDDDEE